MIARRISALVELFRATPASCSLLALGPIVLAIGQLLNSYLNGVSPTVSVGFALTMIAFAAIATGHHAAEYRLRELESGFEP